MMPFLAEAAFSWPDVAAIVSVPLAIVAIAASAFFYFLSKGVSDKTKEDVSAMRLLVDEVKNSFQSTFAKLLAAYQKDHGLMLGRLLEASPSAEQREVQDKEIQKKLGEIVQVHSQDIGAGIEELAAESKAQRGEVEALKAKVDAGLQRAVEETRGIEAQQATQVKASVLRAVLTFGKAPLYDVYVAASRETRVPLNPQLVLDAVNGLAEDGFFQVSLGDGLDDSTAEIAPGKRQMAHKYLRKLIGGAQD